MVKAARPLTESMDTPAFGGCSAAEDLRIGQYRALIGSPLVLPLGIQKADQEAASAWIRAVAEQAIVLVSRPPGC